MAQYVSTLEAFRAKVVVGERRKSEAGNILVEAPAGKKLPFSMTEEEEESAEAAARQTKERLDGNDTSKRTQINTKSFREGGQEDYVSATSTCTMTMNPEMSNLLH